MQHCRTIADSSVRLACYDSAVDQDLQPTQLQKSTTPIDPANAAASPTGEELFGKPASAVVETMSGAAKVTIPDSLTATVAGFARARDDRLSVTLDNGQVWRQVDTGRLEMRVGDRVTIRAAMLGSFLLSGERAQRTIRVSRVR